MALYESTFIVRQDVSAQEVDKIAAMFNKIVNDNGGKVEKQEYWGLLNLAYKISKSKKGHYVYFGLNAPAAAVNELERQFKLSEDVIRSLTVRVEALPKGPTPAMKKDKR